MRVLLVENDLTLARGLGSMLKSGGAVVDHCDTGAEALELVRHYDYDIVLLELRLPDMEGHEVVRRMRSARIEVPVLVGLVYVCLAARRWFTTPATASSTPAGEAQRQ